MEIARLNQDQRLMCVIPEQGNSLVTLRESFRRSLLVRRRLMRVMGKYSGFLLLYERRAHNKGRDSSGGRGRMGFAIAV